MPIYGSPFDVKHWLSGGKMSKIPNLSPDVSPIGGGVNWGVEVLKFKAKLITSKHLPHDLLMETFFGLPT